MNKCTIILLILCLCFLCSCQNKVKKEGDDLAYEGFRPIGDESIITNPALWGELNVHDPEIIKAGDTYYVFSTDASYGNMHKSGVQVRKSQDLITWQYMGTAFEDYVSECAEAVEHAKLDVNQNKGFWAPVCIEYNGKYRLYFSASTFGSSRSAIGLAESDKPEGPYDYKGIVVKTEVNAVNGPNAIDPAIINDKEGRQYMVYGSFSGGIFMNELDPQTGFIKDKNSSPQRIAGSRGAAIEAAAVCYIEESGYYYLFVSYGSLSSNYNIRVGRSKDVTGPYLDANGNDLISLGAGNEEQVGTKLMGGYTFVSNPGVNQSKGNMAPGHNSILLDGEDYYIVHHTRTYSLPEHWFTMNVRRFYINKFEWPVIMPHRYYGEEKNIATELPNGEYAFIEHLQDSNSESHKSRIINMENGSISGAANGTYNVYDNCRIEINIDCILYDGIVQPTYDWERRSAVYAFSAMSEDGLCIWGSTQL